MNFLNSINCVKLPCPSSAWKLLSIKNCDCLTSARQGDLDESQTRLYCTISQGKGMRTEEHKRRRHTATRKTKKPTLPSTRKLLKKKN